MNSKRIFALILSVIMVLSLAACGSDKVPEDTQVVIPDGTVSENVATEPTMKNAMEVNPFDHVDIKYSGAYPYITPIVKNKSSDSRVSKIVFDVIDIKSTAETFEYTIKAWYNGPETDNVKLLEDTKNVKLTKFEKFFSNSDKLDSEFRKEIVDSAADEIVRLMANSQINVDGNDEYFPVFGFSANYLNLLNEYLFELKGVDLFNDENPGNYLGFTFKFERGDYEMYYLVLYKNLVYGVEGDIRYSPFAELQAFSTEDKLNDALAFMRYTYNSTTLEYSEDVIIEREETVNDDYFLNFDMNVTFGSFYNDDEKVYAIQLINKDMPLVQWTTSDGVKHSTEEFGEGKYIIEVFGPNCGYCRGSIPEVDGYREKYPDIPLISITFDNNDVGEFNQLGEYAFFIEPGTEASSELYNYIPWIPAFVFVEDGTIKLVTFGGVKLENLEYYSDIAFN